MSISKYELYEYQLVHYFVTKYKYQIIRVNQHQEDLWLANDNGAFPVIRICSRGCVDEDTIQYVKSVHRMILELIQRKGSLLVVDTAEETTTYQEDFIRYVHVTPTLLSDKNVSRLYGDLSSILHDVDDRKEEIALLSKEIEEAQVRNQKTFLAETKRKMRPKVSLAFMGISAVFMAILTVVQLLSHSIVPAMVASGAYYKTNVVAAFEFWRFLTAPLVYPDFLLYMIMMFVLYQVAKQCEPLFHRKQFLILFFGSLLAGYLSVFISDGNTVAFGAGSLIWGMIGAYYVGMIESKTYRIPMIQAEMIKLGVYGLLCWSLPGMSILGHLSGFLFGALFMCSILPTKHHPEMMKHAKNSLILFVCLLIAGCFFAKDRLSFDSDFDREIVKIYEHTWLDDYANYLESCYNKAYRLE